MSVEKIQRVLFEPLHKKYIYFFDSKDIKVLSIPLVAVTQCQLSWALLATIGCSAVSSDINNDDDNDDANDDDQAQVLKLRHFTLRCRPPSIFLASQSSERKCSLDLLELSWISLQCGYILYLNKSRHSAVHAEM